MVLWGHRVQFRPFKRNAVYFSRAVCSSSDQSGVLHEVYKSGPQLEENAVQKTEWGVWSQNQRGDKVRMFLLLRPDWAFKALLLHQRLIKKVYTHHVLYI